LSDPAVCASTKGLPLTQALTICSAAVPVALTRARGANTCPWR
jgi:hypothetical protein